MRRRAAAGRRAVFRLGHEAEGRSPLRPEGETRLDRAAEVGRRAGASEATVKTYLSHLLLKLGLRDRTQAVVLACETDVVGPGG